MRVPSAPKLRQKIMDDNMKQLMDAMNGHSITDENGQLAETPAIDEHPIEEQPAVTETEPTEETQAVETTEQETAETDPDEAVDEDGKKYVPKKRFDEIYAKWKEAERSKSPDKQIASPQPSAPISSINSDRASMLETEILNQTLPQFNPNSPEYSSVLDEMGAEIYQSSLRYDQSTGQLLPTITKLEAARRALDRAKKLMGVQEQARKEARIVKTQQSDSGITTTTRKVAEKKPEDMSLEEKEAFLKANGMW